MDKNKNNKENCNKINKEIRNKCMQEKENWLNQRCYNIKINAIKDTKTMHRQINDFAGTKI